MASWNNGGRPTEITDIHPEIIQAHILSKIDGPTLASTACASPGLQELCTNEKVWIDICNSTWGSTKHPLVQDTISTFPGGYHSFFSDSFPILYPGQGRSRRRGHNGTPVQTSELISAVDIHYKNKQIYSKVDVTSTCTDPNLTFRVELLDPKESVEIPVTVEGDDEDMYLSDLKEYMTLSWIIIDPTQSRAANVSSLRPVTVRPHWDGGDIEVKYATLLADDHRAAGMLVEFRIVILLGLKEGGELQLRRVNLQVQDMESKCLSVKESFRILQEAIRSGERKKAKSGEETDRYRKFVYIKRETRERKQNRRPSTNFHAPATIFLAFIVLVFLVLVILV